MDALSTFQSNKLREQWWLEKQTPKDETNDGESLVEMLTLALTEIGNAISHIKF